MLASLWTRTRNPVLPAGACRVDRQIPGDGDIQLNASAGLDNGIGDRCHRRSVCQTTAIQACPATIQSVTECMQHQLCSVIVELHEINATNSRRAVVSDKPKISVSHFLRRAAIK